jgi:hypothetical protein
MFFYTIFSRSELRELPQSSYCSRGHPSYVDVVVGETVDVDLENGYTVLIECGKICDSEFEFFPCPCTRVPNQNSLRVRAVIP